MPNSEKFRWLVKKNGDRILQKQTFIYGELSTYLSDWEDAYPIVFEEDIEKEK